MSAPRPIIIVTGANSGVGFGVCHRLLVQLAQKTPSDAQPQFKSVLPCTNALDTAAVESYDGLTLILACRSESRALAARNKLLRLLDQFVAKEKQRVDYDGHAERFRKNVEINFHQVDMSVASSVYHFTDEICNRYSYVSHLICNAGCAFWSGVDKLLAIRVILTRGLSWSITLPPFKLQRTGIMSEDGLGMTWQSNLFSHYVMYRRFQPLFSAYAQRFGRPARVIWTSSLEGQPCWYNDKEDWQLVKTDHSYEASKYQIDLIAGKLDQRSRTAGGEASIVRHFVAHPGIAHSNMTKNMVWFFLDMCKVALFWVARWIGSTNHPILAYTAAVSAVHIALVSLTAIPTSLLGYAHVRSKTTPPTSLWEESLPNMSMYDNGLQTADEIRIGELKGKTVPLKFGSETDRLGRDRVGVLPVLEWPQHEKEAEFLLDKCEGLHQSFSALHTPSLHTNGHAK